jgi:hypothetical protein
MFWSPVNLAVLAITQCEESAGAGSQGKLLPGVGSNTGVRLPAGFRTPNCRLYARFTFPGGEDRLMQLREDDEQHGSNLAPVGEGTSRRGLPPKKSPVVFTCGISVLQDSRRTKAVLGGL